MGIGGLRRVSGLLCILGALMALSAALPAAAYAADVEVTDIRVGKHGLSTRIVVDLDRPVEARVFTLAGPARLVIDLPEVGWRLPPRPLPSNTGLLSKLRYGLFQPGNSRIVVDLREPSRVHDAIALPGSGDQPDRLVIDLARATGKVFLQSVAAPLMVVRGSKTQIVSAKPVTESQPKSLPKSQPASKPSGIANTPLPSPVAPSPAARSVEVPVKPSAPAAATQPATAAPAVNGVGNLKLASLRVPRKPAVPGLARKRIIVIDPGHGGVDPGAISVSGVYEKHITLAAARALQAHLESTGRFEVRLTRDRDVFIRLRDRIEIAREKKADLFISLHADTIRNSGVRGLSLYTLSERASDKEAAALAERENKADLIAGIDLSHESAEVTNILIDLAQRETMNQSAKLAALLVDELKERVRILQNPHRFAGFAVLKAPDIPSVLIELGFLSNRDDERALRSKAHRRKLAQSIAGAVDRYFTKIESASR